MLQATIRISTTLLAAHVETLPLPFVYLGPGPIRVYVKQTVYIGTKLFDVLILCNVYFGHF